ncbi:MAG: sulfurtransferase [Bacteroidota bacterium]
MTPIISATDLGLLIGNPNLIIIDCRHQLTDVNAGEQAWRDASLPGAAFLHLDRDLSGEIIPGVTGRHPLPTVAKFTAKLAGLGLRRDTFVVAYDDKGGGIAARLWWMLRSLGHERVAVLDGGIQAWIDQKLRISEGKMPKPKAEADVAHLATTFFPGTCDRAQTDKFAQNEGYTVIDSRTADRYSGEHEPIDPIAGHIPGAVNFSWTDNLQNGRLKSRQELKIRFAELSSEADHLVFYCGSGVIACHNILAYHHAYGKMPKLYPGSWSEYLLGVDVT